MTSSPERVTAVISSREQADEVMRRHGIDPQFAPVAQLREVYKSGKGNLELDQVRDFLRLHAYETQIADIFTILANGTHQRRGHFEPITNRQRIALEGQFVRLKQLRDRERRYQLQLRA